MHRLILIALVLSFTAIAHARVEDDIRAVDTARVNALLHGDRATLESLLADDLIYSNTDGMIDNKASLLNALRQSSATYRDYQGTPASVRVLDTTALVNGSAELQRVGQNQSTTVYFRYLAVYHKRGDTWQLVAYQSTPMPTPTAIRH